MPIMPAVLLRLVRQVMLVCAAPLLLLSAAEVGPSSSPLLLQQHLAIFFEIAVTPRLLAMIAIPKQQRPSLIEWHPEHSQRCLHQQLHCC